MILESKLSPEGVILVDVAYEVGVFAGAYTTKAAAFVTITSSQKRYQGFAVLEMLFHEASHAYATDKLDRFIEQEIANRQLGKEHTRLWHFIQFLIVGSIVETVLSENQIEYQMYYLKAGVSEKSQVG